MSTANADPDTAPSMRPINDRMGPDGRTARTALPQMGLGDRMEAWLSRVSNQNELVRKLFSSIWLPYAFRSGITMKSVSDRSFVAVLPFRRFNRNWYNAMAGAAAREEVHASRHLAVAQEGGADYIVVCKEMRYRFLRPCVGPAVYRVCGGDELGERIAKGGEFNIDLVMDIVQQVRPGRGGREKRVGQCDITFHCMPKAMLKARRASRG
ncbi:MAG: hypothetical protein ACKOQW_08740 [Phycisphaerales bacterium]